MSTEEKLYCVYKHTSPSGKVYIGITGQEPEARWRDGKGYISNEYFYRAICKYGWENFDHQILFENLTKMDACNQEINMIALYDSANPNKGYNLSTGGECGAVGAVRGEAYRIKLSQAMKGCNNPNYGKPRPDDVKQKISQKERGKYVSDEVCQKISDSKKGKSLSNEHKKQISLTSQGRKFSEEHKSNLSKRAKKKAVVQYDTDNNQIIEYISISEAEKITKVHHSAIIMCCKGKRKTAGGFIWRYKEDE